MHFQKLERMYLSAPTNAYYRPAIKVDDGACEIRITARPEFHHAAQAVHGSVYFKLLDDAAFFAANSVVSDVLVLTSSFTLHFLRPVSEGVLLARGKVINAAARQVLAEAQLFDDKERLIAHGTGTFVKSKIALTADLGYSE
jgi:uncharacterized protein (TIGR00369 family)